MSALVENLKTLHYESVELNARAPPNIVRIFLSMRLSLSNRSYRSALAHFASFIDRLDTSILLPAACLSIRIERRISNSVPTERTSLITYVYATWGSVNVSIHADDPITRELGDSPSLFRQLYF